MIEDDAISNVAGQRLLTLDPAFPVVWEGKSLLPASARPFLIFNHVPTNRIDDTTTADAEIAQGFFDIAIMAEPNLFTTPALVKNASGIYVPSCGAIAKSIRALFPYGLKMSVTGGTVEIMRPPQKDLGYPDGPHWRVPVRIPYMAY